MYFRGQQRPSNFHIIMRIATIIIVLLSVFSSASFAQANYFIVTGRVVNAENKQPLAGASVFAENTTIGTATDGAGNFKLYLPNGGYTLVVTFTGFNTDSRRINTSDSRDSSLTFEMKQKEKELEAVAVV